MKKIDRTNQKKLIAALKRVGKKDLRVGQIFEIIRREEEGDLFYIENDELAKLINEHLGKW